MQTADTIRKPFPAIVTLSALIAAFLFWLIYFKSKVAAPDWVSALPTAIAAFNSLAAICLVFGYVTIRRRYHGNKPGDEPAVCGKCLVVHQRFMLSATAFSALFLISYVTYHFFRTDTHFPGQGIVRPIYFSILISHITLSVIALPLILATLWYALRGRFQFHRRIARWTFPIWLYISITGVVVYFFLRAYTA